MRKSSYAVALYRRSFACYLLLCLSHLPCSSLVYFPMLPAPMLQHLSFLLHVARSVFRNAVRYVLCLIVSCSVCFLALPSCLLTFQRPDLGTTHCPGELNHWSILNRTGWKLKMYHILKLNQIKSLYRRQNIVISSQS